MVHPVSRLILRELDPVSCSTQLYCFNMYFLTTLHRKHRLLTGLYFFSINSKASFWSKRHMTAIFQDCEKTLVVSDRFTILVINSSDVWKYLLAESSQDSI